MVSLCLTLRFESTTERNDLSILPLKYILTLVFHKNTATTDGAAVVSRVIDFYGLCIPPKADSSSPLRVICTSLSCAFMYSPFLCCLSCFFFHFIRRLTYVLSPHPQTKEMYRLHLLFVSCFLDDTNSMFNSCQCLSCSVSQSLMSSVSSSDTHPSTLCSSSS